MAPSAGRGGGVEKLSLCTGTYYTVRNESTEFDEVRVGPRCFGMVNSK